MTEELAQIRWAVPDDAQQVIAMLVMSCDHENEKRPTITEAQFLRDAFGRNPALKCLVAEVNGRVIGMGIYHGAYDSERGLRGNYLFNLFVLPQWRRKGWGRKLIAAICRETSSDGGAFLWWTYKENNEEADRFYSSFADLDRGRVVADLYGSLFNDMIADRPAHRKSK